LNILNNHERKGQISWICAYIKKLSRKIWELKGCIWISSRVQCEIIINCLKICDFLKLCFDCCFYLENHSSIVKF
jgi:hypothetical protein